MRDDAPDERPPDAACAPRGQAATGSFRRFLVVGGTCTAIRYSLLALPIDGLGLALNIVVFEGALRLGAPHHLIAQAVATAITMG